MVDPTLPDSADAAAKIEALVLERATSRARSAIRTYLRAAGPRDWNAKAQASEWLRRLGEPVEALRVLTGFERVSQEPATLIRIAYLLCQLGATRWALRLIEPISPRTAAEHRLVGQIWLDCFEAARAIPHLERARAETPDPMLLISCADAYASIGESTRAIALLDTLVIEALSPLHRAIYHQCRGEYLARARRYAEAERELVESERRFPAADDTVDRGFLEKWLGIARVGQGQRVAGEVRLHKAKRLLSRPALRPEMWLETERQLVELGVLDRKTVLWLRAYPGTPAGFRRQLPEEPRVFFVEGGAERAGRARDQRRLLIYADSDEYVEDGRLHFRLPLELRVVSALVRAGRFGMNRTQLKSELWPNEVAGYFTLEQRLHALIPRASRVYGIELEKHPDRLRIDPARSTTRVRVVLGSGRLSQWLRQWLNPGSRAQPRGNSRVFTMADLLASTDVSRSQAKQLLRRWRQAGAIEETGRGRARAYRIRPTSVQALDACLNTDY